MNKKQCVYNSLVAIVAVLTLVGPIAPASADSVQEPSVQVNLDQGEILAKLVKDAKAEVAVKVATERKAAEAANPYRSRSAAAIAAAASNAQSGNMYPIGQCTWGVKELAPWAHTYWGNGGDWAASAAADGFTVGTVPVVGAIAVWSDGGYGHVAYVTDVQSETSIQVLEANIGGNPNIANYRGFFNPTTTSEGVVSYIYPVAPQQ